MQKSIEPLRAPLRRIQTTIWGDCDPAGIIYTPRVLDYALETLEEWNKVVLGVPWLQLSREMSMGFPTVRTEIDFINSPAVDDDIVLELAVLKLGRTSLTTLIIGHDDVDKTYFQVKLISCLITLPDFAATEIPAKFRQRILAYQAACPENEPGRQKETAK